MDIPIDETTFAIIIVLAIFVPIIVATIQTTKKAESSNHAFDSAVEAASGIDMSDAGWAAFVEQTLKSVHDNEFECSLRKSVVVQTGQSAVFCCDYTVSELGRAAYSRTGSLLAVGNPVEGRPVRSVYSRTKGFRVRWGLLTAGMSRPVVDAASLETSPHPALTRKTAHGVTDHLAQSTLVQVFSLLDNAPQPSIRVEDVLETDSAVIALTSQRQEEHSTRDDWMSALEDLRKDAAWFASRVR